MKLKILTIIRVEIISLVEMILKCKSDYRSNYNPSRFQRIKFKNVLFYFLKLSIENLNRNNHDFFWTYLGKPTKQNLLN